MYRYLVVLLAALQLALAAPQGFTVITIWPPAQNTTRPATTPAPISTSASSKYNPCEEGYTPDYRNWCRPITTTSSKRWCASGFASDIEGYCHRTSTASSSSTSSFTCSSGFIPDYRGYSYCRKTFSPTPYEPSRATSSAGTPTRVITSFVPIRSYMPGGCSSGWVPDYRGFCELTAPLLGSTVEKRVVTTEIVEGDVPGSGST